MSLSQWIQQHFNFKWSDWIQIELRSSNYIWNIILSIWWKALNCTMSKAIRFIEPNRNERHGINWNGLTLMHFEALDMRHYSRLNFSMHCKCIVNAIRTWIHRSPQPLDDMNRIQLHISHNPDRIFNCQCILIIWNVQCANKRLLIFG